MKKVAGVLFVFAALIAAGCQKAAETPAATPSNDAAMVATPKSAETTGVAECDSYMAAVQKYLNCAKVPQAARDAQAQAAKQMKSSWASWATMPEGARKMAQDAAKTSCSSALSTLKQAAAATGCPVE